MQAFLAQLAGTAASVAATVRTVNITSMPVRVWFPNRQGLNVAGISHFFPDYTTVLCVCPGVHARLGIPLFLGVCKSWPRESRRHD
jgi:hypothetical protein